MPAGRSRVTLSALGFVLAAICPAACSSDSSGSSATPALPAATTTTLAESPTTVAATSATTATSRATDESGTTTAATNAPASTTQASEAPTSEAPTSEAPTTEAAPAVCVGPETAPVVASAVDAGLQEWSITSFDGAVIRAHWFPVPSLADDATAPTVLMGPGWGSSGDTSVVLGGNNLNIGGLLAAGFNVLTWDPRGFGLSTGTVEVDSPEYEARDVEQLLSWLATQPQVQLDGAGDPRVGMVGASYGGGIQLVTAALDCRIDAIVPTIAWHSLQTSLFKANTPKTGWAGLLAAASAGHDLDPTIPRATAAGPTGVVDPADVQWFIDRGPGDLVDQITAPTLIIQGTVDTLFTLDEGVTNFDIIADNRVPVAMMWFCGGHGVCLTHAGDTKRPRDAALAWLLYYVKGDTSVDLGKTFEFVDQDGVSYTADAFPAPGDTPLFAVGSGTLTLEADGGSGPAGAGIGGITPAKAVNAVNVSIPAAVAFDRVVVGAPVLKVTYTGTTPDGAAPTRVFAQLVDDSTGLVVGNQITPIEVTLDGASHTAEVPLEMIAYTAHEGTTLTLQLAATSVAYAVPRLGGSIDFSTIEITLPVVTDVSPVEG
jgi:ABC-2 type transport system ATP-binding protein